MKSSRHPWSRFTQLSLSFCLSIALGACATYPAKPIVVNLVAINDFHGHLDAEKFSLSHAGDTTAQTLVGGGVEILGANLQAWRQEDQELLLVGGGDLIGASPGISSLFADEPSIEALNLMGMRVSALGNHEFDSGVQELKRQQNGGCSSPRPDKACKFNPEFSGAKFSYIAANVIDRASGKVLFPAYHIAQAHGVKIGFIGAVLRDTPMMSAAENVRGLDFIDEAEAINRTIPALKAQGVKVFVVLIHEGGTTSEAFDQPACSQLKGPIVDIVKRLDPAIKLIVSGHSHTGFLCKVDGRTVTQAQMYGHMLTRLALTIDGSSHEVSDINARNIVMTPSTAPVQDAVTGAIASLMVKAREASRAALTRPVAKLAVPVVSRKLNDAGESPLGNLVADAQLAAVKNQGVQIAFMNNKGIRGNLEAGADNVSSYGQNTSVLPFGNTLTLMSFSGAQIRVLLEQQMWLDEEAPDGRNVLQVSDGFTYIWDRNRPVGQRVIPESVKLNGIALDDASEYRIAANNFLAGGGDRMPMFPQGKNRIDTSIKDLDVFITYLKARELAGQPAGSNVAAGRVKRLN
ncbi:MAG: bifunctional metallophosphatase/5'-nucleotidase [Pseudomonadota bacterium]